MAAAAYLYSAEPLAEEDREQLILAHLPQVRLIARKIHERLPENICFDDLLSAGVIGLINAVDHFDPTQNVKLKTYAEFRIRGAILDSLRDIDWAPRLRRRQARDIETAIAKAEQRFGRTPEEGEIATQLGLPLDEYRQRLVEIEGLNVGEMEFARDEHDEPALLRYVAAADEDSPAVTLERAELERLIASSIERIPKSEKTVLSLYFFEELTLREIAEVMGVHLSRVSQIKTQAILRLRTSIGKSWPLTGR